MNQKLANIAQQEAYKGYHGFVIGIKPNIEEIWDNHWCAAFVYYCWGRKL